MFSYLSSDSDNDSTNNDDGDGLVESISSPPLTNDVNSSQSTSISKRKFTSDVWQTFSIKADKAICKCGETLLLRLNMDKCLLHGMSAGVTVLKSERPSGRRLTG
jgi:hypothetical protein